MMQFNPELPPIISDRPSTVGIALSMIESAVRYIEVDEANTKVEVAWPNNFRAPIGPAALRANIDFSQPETMSAAVQTKETKEVIPRSVVGASLDIAELSQQASIYAADRGTIEEYLNDITQ